MQPEKKKWGFSKGKAYFGHEGVPEEVETVSTFDIYEAAYWMTIGLKLQGVFNVGSGKLKIVMGGADAIKRALGYLNNEAIAARDYASNIKEIKDKVVELRNKRAAS